MQQTAKIFLLYLSQKGSQREKPYIGKKMFRIFERELREGHPSFGLWFSICKDTRTFHHFFAHVKKLLGDIITLFVYISPLHVFTNYKEICW